MPKTNEYEEDTNEKLNPDEGGPFKLGKLLGRNKRELIPDANKLQITTIEDSPSYWANLRRWALRNHVPTWLLVLFTFGLAYGVPQVYYPAATNLVFGTITAALVGGASFAFENEKRQDKSHNVFVDEIMIMFKESVVRTSKGKDGIESQVIQPKVTRRAIYLGKDYMFDGPKDDPYRIEKINAQIVGTFGKIIDVSQVDDSGRIIIGEGDGDMPAGLAVKMAYPSRSQMSEAVRKADKARKEGAIPEAEFLAFKKKVDIMEEAQGELLDYVMSKGIGMIDMDKMTKKQRSFFVALDKFSTNFWNGREEDTMSLKEWTALDPAIKLPKILKLQSEYDNIKAERLDLLLNRESDKIEAELDSTINLMQMTGQSEEAIDQFLIEQRKGLVSTSSRTEKEMESEAGA